MPPDAEQCGLSFIGLGKFLADNCVVGFMNVNSNTILWVSSLPCLCSPCLTLSVLFVSIEWILGTIALPSMHLYCILVDAL